MAYYELKDHFEVQADLPTTWQFFSAVENLAKITPPWLAFTVRMNGPLHISDGSILDYTIRWLGVPIKWRTRIHRLVAAAAVHRHPIARAVCVVAPPARV